MKLNWGHGIFIFYTVFALSLLGVLIASFKVDRGLVLDDYYSLDLAYQARKTAVKNAKIDQALKTKYNKDAQELVLNFNAPAAAQGSVHLYRPSNEKMDIRMAINSNTMFVPTKDLAPGAWKVKIEWRVGDKEYYHEEALFI